jgi:hypothetical protein
MADNTRQKTVVIADYDYDDVERAIIEEAGLRLATARRKSEDDVIAVAGRGCDHRSVCARRCEGDQRADPVRGDRPVRQSRKNPPNSATGAQPTRYSASIT